MFCKVKRFVRKGVPNEHRTKIWMAASGAQEQMESHQGYYQSLLAVEQDPKLKETIHIGELFSGAIIRLTNVQQTGCRGRSKNDLNKSSGAPLNAAPA